MISRKAVYGNRCFLNPILRTSIISDKFTSGILLHHRNVEGNRESTFRRNSEAKERFRNRNRADKFTFNDEPAICADGFVGCECGIRI